MTFNNKLLTTKSSAPSSQPRQIDENSMHEYVDMDLFIYCEHSKTRPNTVVRLKIASDLLVLLKPTLVQRVRSGNNGVTSFVDVNKMPLDITLSKKLGRY